MKKKRSPTAFTGEGARLYGGRWNRPGTSIVYLSENLSLAALELFVHLGKIQTHLELVAFRIQIPTGVKTKTIDRKKLPVAWRQQPPPEHIQAIGTEWAKQKKTCILFVPSALIPEENNLLINPEHKDFKKLIIGKPAPFSFDPRMWK